MDGIFGRLAAASRTVVERVHGTDVEVIPIDRKDPNGAARPSETEPAYDTVACFYEDTLTRNEARAQPLSGDGRSLHRALVRTASIRLVPDKPFATNFLLRRKSDGAVFSIGQFDPDGVGNVMAALSVAKPAAVI